MFVKVWLNYGSGPKSAISLDLLLYDSQCWHCSITGECNAKESFNSILYQKTRDMNLEIFKTQIVEIILTYLSDSPYFVGFLFC